MIVFPPVAGEFSCDVDLVAIVGVGWGEDVAGEFSGGLVSRWNETVVSVVLLAERGRVVDRIQIHCVFEQK